MHALIVSLLAAALADASRARFLMGTVCEITAPATSAESAFVEAARIDKFLSTWRADSELSRVNAAHGGRVSPELAAVLARAMELARETDGAFDPLVRPIGDAWRIRDGGALPSEAQIADAARRAAMSNVSIDGNAITLIDGAEFDEGGFGKGYAIDRMMALLPCGTTINFGGQIAVCGERRVSIADPEHRDHAVLELTLSNASLSTSSGSEKTFDSGGVRFSHLLDPRSGRALPPRGSASAIAASAFDADAFSTALYVMDVAGGIRWANAHHVAAIFITPEHDIVTSAAVSRRDLRILDSTFRLKD